MDVLYLVMPAYNEEDNIVKTVRQWYPVVARHNGDGRSRLLIVNDGSRDGTLEKCMKLRLEYPLLDVVDKKNSGHGPTVIFAYERAIAKGADYVFQTDSDGQTSPDEFEGFWEEREKYAGIFGIRKKRGDGVARAYVEKVVCLLLRIYFGVRLMDANAPFRLMRASVLKKYLSKLPRDYNLPNIMLTTYFVYYEEEVAFKEISFKPRTAGVNSINLKRIFLVGWDALGDFWTFKRDMKGSTDCLGKI